jgi:hypothetical protein
MMVKSLNIAGLIAIRALDQNHGAPPALHHGQSWYSPCAGVT